MPVVETYGDLEAEVGLTLLGGSIPQFLERSYARQAHAFGLTRREREVANLLRQGLSNKEIAEALCRTEQTVKNHVTHILERTDAHDRLQAVLRLYGLL